MNDEWGLQVDPQNPSHAQALTERLEARELEHDLSNAFHDRVIVSRDDTRVFLYAGSREQAERARELLLSRPATRLGAQSRAQALAPDGGGMGGPG